MQLETHQASARNLLLLRNNAVSDAEVKVAIDFGLQFSTQGTMEPLAFAHFSSC